MQNLVNATEMSVLLAIHGVSTRSLMMILSKRKHWSALEVQRSPYVENNLSDQ